MIITKKKKKKYWKKNYKYKLMMIMNGGVLRF